MEWTPGVGLPEQRDFYEYLRHQQPTRDTLLVDSGDVDDQLSTAEAVLTATYAHPYQMHGSVGTSCAVADVHDDRATIWSATQAVHPLRSTAAMILGLPAANLHVIFARGAGCYGINGADTVSYDAALLSQAVGRPVRVQLSRQDEMGWENYGSAFVIDQRAGVDADGTIVAWDCEAWSPRLGSRPGYQTPGNVITGFLVGFQPAAFTPRTPAPVPAGEFRNRSNAGPSYVAGCVVGVCGGTGTVHGERVLSHSVTSPFWTGPLRSPARLQHTFAHECFMDELAARAGVDSVRYRVRHLSDRRLIEVVTSAAQAAGWAARPSPKPDLRRSGVATGRGIACVLYEGDNGYCALVAEVEVDQDTGAIAVRRFVVGHDCGPISNPDGLRNQIEGGALQDLNRAEQVLVDLLSEGAALAIIGDDDQSIYRLKYANPDGIREFNTTHDGTVDVAFTECRRCPHQVVTLAQTLIQRNPGRIRGPLTARAGNPHGEIHNPQWTSIEEEAQGIATFIDLKVQAGVDPGMCLVLASSRQIGYAIRDAVQTRGIDIRSFFREQAVENELAQEKLTVLTLLANPDDRLALRSWLGLNSPSALVGSYRALLRAAQEKAASVRAILEALDAEEIAVRFTDRSLKKWRDLQRQLAALEPLGENLQAIIDAVLPDTGQDAADDDLALLRRTALSCIGETQSLADLPGMIRYRISQPEVPLETPYARVMSFHRSKGLTVDLVVLAGLVDGVMPRIKSNVPEQEQRAQLEEQRRVFFVGMTRTTNTLVFSGYSQLPSALAMNLQARRGRYHWRDQTYTTFASPFLEETGNSLPPAVRAQDWVQALA